MEKIFCLGLVMGAVGGALLVANSYKARSLVKKSQSEVMQKVNDMMDEKLQACSSGNSGDSEKKSKKA